MSCYRKGLAWEPCTTNIKIRNLIWVNLVNVTCEKLIIVRKDVWRNIFIVRLIGDSSVFIPFTCKHADASYAMHGLMESANTCKEIYERKIFFCHIY